MSAQQQSIDFDLAAEDRRPQGRTLEGGLWIARKIGLHGPTVNTQLIAGLTSPAERIERLAKILREAIIGLALEAVICGRGPDGKPNTYAQAFERWSCEEL